MVLSKKVEAIFQHLIRFYSVLAPNAKLRALVVPQEAVRDREVTGGGKASVTLERFRCVDTLIGNVKTALTGTYHAIKFAKYAYRYLGEVQFRFNRRYNMPAILGFPLRALATTLSGLSGKFAMLSFIANQVLA